MSSHHVNDLTEWNTILVPLKNNVVIHLLDVQVVVAGLDIHGSTGGKGAALGGGDRGGGRGGVVLLNIGCQGSNLAAVQPVAGKLQRRRGKREGSAIESSQEHEATTEGECTPTHTHTHTSTTLSHSRTYHGGCSSHGDSGGSLEPSAGLGRHHAARHAAGLASKGLCTGSGRSQPLHHTTGSSTTNTKHGLQSSPTQTTQTTHTEREMLRFALCCGFVEWWIVYLV